MSYQRGVLDLIHAAAVELPQSEEDPWIFRPYSGSEDDESGLMYLLGVSYTRSKAGWRAGASGAGSTRTEDATVRDAAVAKQQAFLAVHRPIWRWLLENAEISLAVDREKPDTDIWAWMVTSGPDVLHALGCKRSLVKAGLARELVLKLGGDRWEREQVLTLELPGVRTESARKRTMSTDVVPVSRPHGWTIDPTWLLTRMVGR